MQLINHHIDEVKQLCATYGVLELYVFGSVLNDTFHSGSDIDLVVRFSQIPLEDYFNNYMGLKEGLESLFQRKVDLIEDKAVNNPIFRRVLDREMKMVYDRAAA
jgi:predicted nucleotidyltransferase